MTTAALALGAAASADSPRGEVLVVEMDPAGGDLECWCGPHGEPGLLGAVTEIHDTATAPRLHDHTVDVVPGVRALLAPTTGQSVAAALQAASSGFIDAVAGLGTTLIADLGRWSTAATSHVSTAVRRASVVVVVCRSTLASIEHARALVLELRAVNRRVMVLVVGSASPYRPEEIAAAVGAPVVGVLPWDARGVGALVVQGATSRTWSRSPLARAAVNVVAGLRLAGGQHPHAGGGHRVVGRPYV